MADGDGPHTGDRELSMVLTDNFYYLQNVMVSLVAQMVKNLPAMQKTLGWENPLEKGMATHSSILAWRIPCTDHGVAKSWT